MDGHRFDDLARRVALANATSRRRLLRGALAAAAGVLLGGRADARATTCPDGQLFRRLFGCVCRTTGRPPGPGGCPCLPRQARCDGDCVDVRSSLDHCGGCDRPCRPRNACETASCRLGVCRYAPISCPAPGRCQLGPGTCDPATGLCGYAARAGIPCGPVAVCADGVLTRQGVCDASGSCRPATPTPCGGYACAPTGAACRTSCAGPGGCLAGYACVGGACVSGIAKGLPCDETDRCGTGLTCVDHVCCDGPCPGPCRTCTMPGSEGTCLPLSGIACDDGDACTETATCQDGACVPGSRRSCDPCQACDPADGACKPADEGGRCDDGNPCTGDGRCAGGACQPGDPIACPPPASECLAAGVCDPTDGRCDYASRTGEPCGPEQACTNGVQIARGVCDAAGVCLPGAQTQCAPFVCGATACLESCGRDEDCLPAYHCDGGACLPDVALGGACDEESDCAAGLVCVVPDGAAQGVCCNEPCAGPCHSCTVAGSAGTCLALSDVACDHPALCVTAARCAAGVCTPEATRACGPCGACDPADGQCKPANAGAACPLGDGSGLDGVCCGGLCVPTCAAPLVLDDACACVCPEERRCGEACCAGETTCAMPERSVCCASGKACEFGSGAICCDNPDDECFADLGGTRTLCCAADSRACELGSDFFCCPDDHACVEQGSGGLCCPPCVNGTTPQVTCACCETDETACPDLSCCGDCHVCDPVNGGCKAADDGTECVADDPCTLTAACQGGTCTAVAVADCGECRACDPTDGQCRNLDDGTPLDPNDPCGDVCLDGIRLARPGCAECEVCDTVTGTCLPTSGGECDLGAGVCCAGDCCLSGNCCANGDCGPTCAAPYVFDAAACACLCPRECCADAECGLCHVCDDFDGTCVPADSGTPCDDSNACTSDTICLTIDGVGVCTATFVTTCPDCQRCDPADGLCKPIPNGTACVADSSECTIDDRCLNGSCVPGEPIVCPLCQNCDPGNGDCAPVADGTACEDGDLCTTDKVCVLGQCVGTPHVDCGACRTCDPATGGCVDAQAGTACNNDDACLGPGSCAGGACIPVDPVVCPECSACDPSSRQCLPTTGGACTPSGGATGSGACCNGACCAPGTACQGTSCVPVTCPTCQAFDATEGECMPVANGTTCQTPDGFFSQCCGGACCVEGTGCCGGVCCDNSQCCEGECCDLCASCEFVPGGEGARACMPRTDGTFCASFFGLLHYCCAGVCCAVDTCAGEVCGSPYPG